MDGEYAQPCWCSIGGRTGHQPEEIFRWNTMRGEESQRRPTLPNAGSASSLYPNSDRLLYSLLLMQPNACTQSSPARVGQNPYQALPEQLAKNQGGATVDTTLVTTAACGLTFRVDAGAGFAAACAGDLDTAAAEAFLLAGRRDLFTEHLHGIRIRHV